MSDIRERTVRWSDPASIVQAGLDLTGLEFLQAGARGEVPPPPVMALIGAEMGEIELGRVTMRLTPGEYLYNPMGSVHGGIIATMLDSVMGCAVHSTLPVGRAYTTLEFKVNFARKLTQDVGTVTAEGVLVQAGRQIALAAGKLIGPDGKLYATATTTCLISDTK